MELVRLRANSQNRPCVDQPPYFSWVIVSEGQNVMQETYRIRVWSDRGEAWDSGVVKSDQSAFVDYEGKALDSLTDYMWSVEVTDNAGHSASADSVFETGFMNGEWRAQWVRSPRPMKKAKKGNGGQNPAEYFRREFSVQKELKRARVYATCHGAYQLSVNGIRPDDRELAPEFTVYEKYLCYQTYDISSLLRAGTNAIGMLVGDGWYNCGYFKPPGRKFRPHRAVLFQIRLEYEDGTSEDIFSDDKIRVGESPVRSSDLFAGEFYDAGMEQDGWDCAGFNDSEWKRGVLMESESFGHLKAQYGEPVRPVRELPPVNLYKSPKGETILDFGQTLAGVLRVRTDFSAGTRLTLDHFEETDRDGNYVNTILGSDASGHHQKDVFLSAGKPQRYTPHFTYHGFRYVRVTCDVPVRAEDFTAVVWSTDNEDLGTFETSNEMINRLYENTRWSQRSNMVSIPTDCPQREKAGWTGDIQIYARTSLLNENTTPFLTRWLQNLACDQHKNGAVPVVVPFVGLYRLLAKINQITCGNRGPVGAAGWGDAACMVPWSMYEITGNRRILREQYDSMKAWCDYIITTAETRKGKNKLPREIDRYLWNTGFQYGEWLIPSQSGNGGDASFSKPLNSSVYCTPFFGWNSCRIMAETAALLGRGEDEEYYRDIADKMKAAIQKGVIREDGSLPVDFMGGYVLAIAFDLASDSQREKMAERLLTKIEENGDCLDTGFLATPYLLDALCKIGRTDKAVTLLLQEKCPSWLYEVKQGATTIWESYISYKPDGEPLATSFNHYAFGCVDDWMFRKICGIDMAAPGFKKIVIAPEVTDAFANAKRTYMSEYGRIGVEWRTEDGHFHMKAEIPCNTTALVRLPDGTSREAGSGTYEFECMM